MADSKKPERDDYWERLRFSYHQAAMRCVTEREFTNAMYMMDILPGRSLRLSLLGVAFAKRQEIVVKLFEPDFTLFYGDPRKKLPRDLHQIVHENIGSVRGTGGLGGSG